MKQILFFCAVVLFWSTSCNKTESGSGGQSSQLFRYIYNNSSWMESGGGILSIKVDKLFYGSDDTSCAYVAEGTYNNIYSDGCTYTTVKNSVVEEDQDTFIIKQELSPGTGVCGPAEYTIFTFQIKDQNTLILREWTPPSFVDSTIYVKISPVATQGCVDGTAQGMLW